MSGVWRDRTNLFISYRQSYAHHPAKRTRFSAPASNGFTDSIAEERRGLMSAGALDDDGDAVIEMDLLPPRWLDVQDEITEHLTNIAKHTRTLEQLHQKHVLPGFDDEDVKSREEQEIEKLTQEITRQFGSSQRAIKRIDRMVGESKQQGNLSKGEETMAKNLKVSLASRVGESSALFRKKQSAYLKKLRSLGGFGSPLDRSSTPIQNPYSDPSMMESETDRSFSQSTLQQTAQHRQRLVDNPNEALIAQREREIESIAQGIIDLANLFQEIQTMVIDQGSMLDRIDYNVERLAVNVKAADQELVVASGYQKRSVKRKAILLLILVIVGMFILLGLKLSRKGSKEAPPSAPVGGPEQDGPPALSRDLDDTAYSNVYSYRQRRDWRRRRRRALDYAGMVR